MKKVFNEKYEWMQLRGVLDYTLVNFAVRLRQQIGRV